MAGKHATEGNVLVLARNEDFTRPNCDKYLAFRRVPQYAVSGTSSVRDGTWTLGNGLRVPVPDAVIPYSAMPDAIGAAEATHAVGDHYFFEERGVNACNVAVSATNSMETNERAKAADPFQPAGVEESILPTLVLPQATSARHGVDLVGSYVETYGASEANGLLIGDPDACWYIEIGAGHHWIAVRVPDGAYIAVANDMRVHDVDLDADSVRHSPGLFEFTEKHRLLDAPRRASFNFAKAFGVLGNPYNVDRVWLAQSKLTPSLVQPERQVQYPLFLAPDRELDVSDVMRVLRATYDGTVLDGRATRPIGYEKRAESHVIVLDRRLPRELTGLIWQAVSTPLGSPYLPLYSAMRHVPVRYARGGDTFSPDSAYWAFLGAHALEALVERIGETKKEAWWREFERRQLERAPRLRAILGDAYRTDRETAVDLAERYSAAVAAQALDLATRESSGLMTEIAARDAEKHAVEMRTPS
ncbi:C69 family dipeptidase [Streptomyces sp. NPDC058735]|uniref:C69 family dipeptidase n=1 Tax=Streptomyces sp. NPDC058735 TaxID=3346616 RepID=UPI003678EA82